MNASRKPGNAIAQESRTVGLGLGDKFSHYCVLAESGEVVEEGRIKTTRERFTSHFERVPRMRIALETGIHSAWVSQLLTSFGHDVIVANAGQIPAITGNDNKTDPNDAENLARFARFDPKLLHPITHRDKSKQMDLTVIRVRARLVEVRTTFISSIRSTVKSFGERLPRCVADSFATRMREALPAELRDVLQPRLVLSNISTASYLMEHRRGVHGGTVCACRRALMFEQMERTGSRPACRSARSRLGISHHHTPP